MLRRSSRQPLSIEERAVRLCAASARVEAARESLPLMPQTVVGMGAIIVHQFRADRHAAGLQEAIAGSTEHQNTYPEAMDETADMRLIARQIAAAAAEQDLPA